MQILKRFPDTIAANLARADLARHGIDAFVADEVLANADPPLVFAMGGVRLMVADEEVDAAAKILQTAEPLDPLVALPAHLPGVEMESEVSGPFPFGDQCRTIFAWFVFLWLASWAGPNAYMLVDAIIRSISERG